MSQTNNDLIGRLPNFGLVCIFGSHNRTTMSWAFFSSIWDVLRILSNTPLVEPDTSALPSSQIVELKTFRAISYPEDLDQPVLLVTSSKPHDYDSHSRTSSMVSYGATPCSFTNLTSFSVGIPFKSCFILHLFFIRNRKLICMYPLHLAQRVFHAFSASDL